ncbi:uncharacterized protein LACBIDRAFT_303948 [Laccaria bicolor S238N-H82]|nr:uncharacterized protein LACBIDRAFT_303948 [Laccaria bicolor S238N-H82]EDQ98324.1 predicted protein [Laccaria bicolor S238N-H82]|eukprot:XP_001891025.1 predicted protein [Laccaria bicolor S238N-H82]
MDYSCNTKEFSMLDKFLPQETLNRPTVTRAVNNQSKAGTSNVNASANPSGTGAWPREVGVQCVFWNSGNGLSASQGISGLMTPSV